MKVKELITALLNEPMDNEIPNIKGISERGFGQPADETYLETKDF